MAEIFIKPDNQTKRARAIYGEKFYKDDLIKMEVNTKEKTIKYYKNDKDLGIAIYNINFKNNIKYNLAISMDFKSDCVKLINFKVEKI